MRRRAALLAVIAILTGTLSFAAASPAQACWQAGAGADELMGLRTYHLEVNTRKASYSTGDIAKIRVLVTRPAHEDPLGENIALEPPGSFPAEDVNVGVGLTVGDSFLFGHTLTDPQGQGVVKIKIADSTQGGKATGDIYAWRKAIVVPCGYVEEDGYKHVPHIFTIARASS